jgi:protein tyrosine phosphatase (PTP) superfamily phosphohydrolase (DUF442 family)
MNPASWLTALSLLLALPAAAEAPAIAAPNVVDITPRIVTSGQPSADALAGLKAKGFDAVIYLAPATVQDAVADEYAILSRQGILFVNIPMQWENPTAADFEAFAGVLRALADRKVLVHCPLNYRASSMVFLYRAIVLHEDADQAYAAVARVWSPMGAWRPFIEGQLRRHGLTFSLL